MPITLVPNTNYKKTKKEKSSTDDRQSEKYFQQIVNEEKYVLVSGGVISLYGLERGSDGQTLHFDGLSEINTKANVDEMMQRYLKRYGGVLGREMYNGTGYGVVNISYEDLTHIQKIKGTLYFSKNTQAGRVFPNKRYSTNFYFISNEFTRQ